MRRNGPMSSTAEPLLALQDDARRPLVAVAEINREGLIASHHSCKGLAFGVASMLKRGVSSSQVLMFFPREATAKILDEHVFR